MNWIVIAIAVASIVFVAGMVARSRRRSRTPMRTPGGLSALMPRLSELDPDLVLLWLDRRVDEWVASRAATHVAENLRRLSAATNFVLVDDYRFPASTSPTGYAAGQYFYESATVYASIYSRGESAERPGSPPAAPHLIRETAPGSWSYGTIPEAGGLEVVPHELDHAISGSFHD